jgi:predicted DNA-binding protein (UPF0251 family)
MAAKQSAEMREAMRLVTTGMTKTAAALQAGVRRTSLQAALAKQKKDQNKVP